jgi:cytochrome c oxidase assembly protein subunit 15
MQTNTAIAPRWIHRFAIFTACCTLLLLMAGALVTGTGSGLSVPDWPLSYGQFMPPMIGGIFYEHGHRMVAGTVAILTICLTIAIQLKEPRAWVRMLSLGGLMVIFTQATLGGLTVLFRLPKPVSISHACLAQIFFSIAVMLAVVTSPRWEAPAEPLNEEEDCWIALPTLALMVSLGFFTQLLLGATMRHLHAGLAIPDFPTSFGGIVPPTFTPEIAANFAHRVGALTMLTLTALLVTRVLRRHGNQLALTLAAGVLSLLVAFQLMLGALVIWLGKPVPVTTIHLAVGALCLATSVVITSRAFRLRRERELPRPLFAALRAGLEIG